MIDTVSFQFLLKPNDALKERNALRKQGINVGLIDGHFNSVSVSLPRLFFRDNSRLIRNQRQLDAALAKLDEILAQHGKIIMPRSSFTRVDLAWQFQESTPRFALSMYRVNHPEIRAEVCLYRDRHRITGIWWKSGSKTGSGGKGGPLIIRAYDKTDRKKSPKQEVLRIEVQLRSTKLRQKLGGGSVVTNLDFKDCYRVFRDTLLRFVPEPVPTITAKDEMLIALAIEAGIATGRPLDELLGTFSSAETVRRYRNVAASYTISSNAIDLAKMLPPSGPPPVVEPSVKKPVLIVKKLQKQPAPPKRKLILPPVSKRPKAPSSGKITRV